MAGGISKIRVTVKTEVIDGYGAVLTGVQRTDEESSGNPSWTGRVAHRITERLADETRVMLAAKYGEIEPEWKEV